MITVQPRIEKLTTASEESPSFLLLHGGPGMDSSYFRESFSEFGKDATIYSYTQATAKNIVTTSDLVRELREIVMEIGRKNIILVGHSYGAALALEYVKEYGTDLQISSVILLAGVVDASWLVEFDKKFKGTAIHNKVLALDEKIETPDAEEAYKRLTLNWLPFYFQEKFLEVGKEKLSRMKFNAKVSEWSWAHYMKEFDLRDVLRSSPVPIGTIYAECDDIVVAEYSRSVLRFIDSRLIFSLKEVGHFPFIEDMAAVKRAMLTFVTLIGGPL